MGTDNNSQGFTSMQVFEVEDWVTIKPTASTSSRPTKNRPFRTAPRTCCNLPYRTAISCRLISSFALRPRQ